MILPAHKGARLDQMDSISYATLRQAPSGNAAQLISLQLNLDYDLTDGATGYQGRLMFEPYLASGAQTSGTWQSWDAKAGKWWGTRTSVTVGGALTPNPCRQASPCTWSQVLAAFPNAGIHAVYGAVVLKAGSGWSAFRGNVDALTLDIAGVSTTYDFERAAPALVPHTPPDSLPVEYSTLSDTISGGAYWPRAVLRDLIVVLFKRGTSQADKQAAIAAVNATVVGGIPVAAGEGVYFLKVNAGGDLNSLSIAVDQLTAFPQVLVAAPDGVGGVVPTLRDDH